MRALWMLVVVAACKKSPEQAPAPAPPPASPAPADAPVIADAAIVVPGDATAAVTLDASASAGPAPVDDTLLDTEHVGALKFHARFDDVVAVVGAPSNKTRAQFEAGTSEYVYRASWPLLEIEFAAETKGDLGTARLLIIRDPSLVTARGIHVGSTRAELAAAYPKSKEPSQDANTYRVGSEYAGIELTLAKGKVTKILVGLLGF